MSNVRQFAAVNTKIKGMVGKLLSKDDYRNMLALRTEEEIYDYLMNHTYYGTIFQDMTSEYTVETIEQQIKNYILTLYKKIMCYISGDYKKLFKLLMKRYEAEDIKAYLRALILKQDIRFFHLNFPKASIYSRLDYEALSLAESLEDFIEMLKDTIYYKVLRLYLNESDDRMLFYMEMNIDRIYFSKLSVEIAKYKGTDERPIFDILRMNIDFLNFQWIYRGRKFYKMSAEEMLNYTLPNGHYLSFNTLKELCYANGDEMLFEIMSETRYKKLFEHENATERYLERDMDRYLFKQFLKSDRESSLNMITVVTFTHRLEFEMRDLFTLIEAKHYGVPAEELKEYLIRVI